MTDCLALFETGLAKETSGCFDAVSRATKVCEYAFRWRNDADPQLSPVLPGPCVLAAQTVSSSTLQLACEKLQVCGRWTDTLSNCLTDLAPLRYDTLSRIGSTTGCDFDLVHMGESPGALGDRCEDNNDCKGLLCVVDKQHGMCVGPSYCNGDGTISVGTWCMPTCTAGEQGAEGPPETDPSLSFLDTECASRMKRSAKQIGDVGYYEVSLPKAVSYCVPVVDKDTCAPDTVVFASPEMPTEIRGALRCEPTNPTGIGWLQPCPVGPPNPCKEGDCMVIPSGSSVCTLPCVAVGPNATYNGCPAEHICVSRGWGMVGACLPSCPAGTCDLWGTTCIEDGWPGPYCVD